MEEEQKLRAGDWRRMLGNSVIWTCPSHCPYKLIVAVGTYTPSWYLTSHWGSSRPDHLLLLLKTCFRLVSDLKALSKDRLCLLAICPWRFSLASFILSAKSLAYSTASSLYFFQYVNVCVAGHVSNKKLNLGWSWAPDPPYLRAF